MNRPGILLDRDGTIIEDYHYVGHVERIQFIPGAIDAILRFNSAGIPVAVITNQGGVARGFYPERNVHEVHAYIERKLKLHGAHIDFFIYSPQHPDGNIKEYAIESDYHKPRPGMAYAAADRLGLDLHNSWVVGDRITDVELARNIEADCIYLGTEPLPRWYSTAGIHSFPSLAAAAGFIIERITGMSQDDFPTRSYNSMMGFFTDYAFEIDRLLSNIQYTDICEVTDIIAKACNTGDTIFIAGNGGAAAIADHFETDFTNHLGRGDDWTTYFFSLNSNTSLITAAANDIGYDAIFSYQLERKALADDVLIVFSVSGNSANIVRAIQCANEMNMTTIAIVATDGGKAAKLANFTIHIPTSNYGIAEDVMSSIMHSMAQYIRQTRMSEQAIQSARF